MSIYPVAVLWDVFHIGCCTQLILLTVNDESSWQLGPYLCMYFLYAQSLNKCNLMGMNKPLRLFTETAQEKAILNGNKRMQNRITWEQNSRAVLKSCVPYLPGKERKWKRTFIIN